MILNRNQPSIDVVIWWIGEKIQATTKSYEHLVDEVCMKTNCRAEELLFIMSDGHELNFENSATMFSQKNSETFAFLALSSTKLPSLLSLPDLPTIPDTRIALPPMGSTSSSLDSQAAHLQKRLQAAKSYLAKVSHAAMELSAYSKSLDEKQSILSRSADVARRNLEIHTLLAGDDLQTAISTTQKDLDSINALIYRCPMDFALMKRIPINTAIMKSLDPSEKRTLFEFKRDEWQRIFTECSDLKDRVVILKEELCELFDKLRNHNQGSKLNDDMDTNRSLRAQISLFLEEVKASLNKIDSVMKVESAEGQISENLLLVQKSGRLLNLAELSSEYTENCLQITTDRLLALFRAAGEKKLAVTDCNELTKRDIDKVIESQELLAEILNGKEELLGSLEVMRSYASVFEEIHAFPVAYVAIICELLKRSSFESNLKRSFSFIERNLTTTLDAEGKRREEFKEEITKIFDVELLTSNLIDVEMDGNAVLFIKETASIVSIEDIEDLEAGIKEDLSTLSQEDPIRLQLSRFLETLIQMKKRTFVEADYLHLGTTKQRTPLQSDRELIQLYEDRIRSLERLLQKSYAEAKGAMARNNNDLNEQVTKLSESLMSLTATDDAEYKLAILEVANILQIRLDSDDGKSLDEVKDLIISRISSLKGDRKITISNFAIDDTILILPTVRSGVWSLFNINQPNYYLHPDSLELLKKPPLTSNNRASSIDWLIGQITSIEAKQSGGRSTNPYRLPKEFNYYEVRAIPVSENSSNEK